MKVHFDLPFDIPSFIGTCFADSPFVHVRLVILDPMQGSKALYELTTEGVKEYRAGAGQQFTVEGRTRNFFTLAVPITIDEYLELVNVTQFIKKCELKWSNWFIMSYLINGTLPSTSCCDLVSLTIKRGVVSFPSSLLQSIGDVIDELYFLKT